MKNFWNYGKSTGEELGNWCEDNNCCAHER
jgi:hypothetical protein